MFSLMRVVASVAFLNALLTLHNIWPTPWVKVVPELSVELFAALLAMALFLEMKIFIDINKLLNHIMNFMMKIKNKKI